jgi:asparagine synthase (glutamine-hydrolysing)
MPSARPASGFQGNSTQAREFNREARPSGHPIARFIAPGAFEATVWNEARAEAHQHRDDDVTVLIHGEVFNAQALRADLVLDASSSVAQILAAAWRRWSVDALPRLDGVFALVVRSADQLCLYRDPSGLRNLYFSIVQPEQVAFATDSGSLLRLPGVARALSRRSLHEYLRFLDIAAPNTWFERVQSVEPGMCVIWPDGKTQALARPPIEQAALAPADFADAVDALDAHLRRSVQVRLADSTRPAAFLSGGIDSSLICAVASRQRRDVTAVTVGFEGGAFDEAPVAKQIAAHLGMAHRVLRFNRDDYIAALERLSTSMDQPMADPATPATLLAFDYCRRNFDTVLDGTGADEAVGAMPPRHVRLAVAYASLLPTSLRRPLARALGTLPVVSGYRSILDFEHPADTMIRWHGFTRGEIEALCGEPVSFADTQFYRTFARFKRSEHFERYSALLGAMPCDRLNQAALIGGMRVHYPFCDRDTDACIRQLRTDWRHMPGEPKRILRALLARYVPRQLWDVPKHGFDFPLLDFLSGDDFALVRRYLIQGRWLDRGLVRPDIVRACARQFMEGDQRMKFRVWALVVLGAWLEQRDACQ